MSLPRLQQVSYFVTSDVLQNVIHSTDLKSDLNVSVEHASKSFFPSYSSPSKRSYTCMQVKFLKHAYVVEQHLLPCLTIKKFPPIVSTHVDSGACSLLTATLQRAPVHLKPAQNLLPDTRKIFHISSAATLPVSFLHRVLLEI